jgi:guanosine-3',5'-bis(diphosphate) 3'-pyrophosphohydrolase
VPGRFKDYISNPKPNDYQSIHTTIVGPRHQRVELQIRTRAMHEVAEYGVAAHALYKDAANGNGVDLQGPPASDSNAYQWLRRLIELLLEGDNPEEFLEHTKLELFPDQVFCFTPKGWLIALPRGANAIDFAYAVHTNVGHSCVGCRINGRHMPLASELRNGDEVEIIRSEAQNSPPPAWENLVKTGKARSAIRRATREAVRSQYVGLGREIVSRACQRAGVECSDEALSRALVRLTQKTVDDVLTAVGRGELSSADVLAAAFPGVAPGEAPKRQKIKRTDEGWFGMTKGIGLKFRWPGASSAQQPSARAREAAGIPIRGLSGDLPVKFDDRSCAVPGDRIVGILNPGEGITIYPIHAEALKSYEDQPERWIDVTWDIDEDSPDRFPAQIAVTALNEPGSLAQIAQVVGEADGNIDNLKMTRRAADFTELVMRVEVWDLKHLNQIMAGLRARDAVSAVSRIDG